MPINPQVIDVVKNINSAKVGPSSSWAPVLWTCCTVHCYVATAHTKHVDVRDATALPQRQFDVAYIDVRQQSFCSKCINQIISIFKTASLANEQYQ